MRLCSLRLQEQASASVYAYDKDPAWSPYKDLTPLLTPAQLDARIKVLEGLKAYADTLVDLTSGKPSPDLENAAEGVGTNLQGLNQNVATEFSTAIPNHSCDDDRLRATRSVQLSSPWANILSRVKSRTRFPKLHRT